MARASLFVGPFGWLIRSFGAVPVERGSATGGIRALLGMLRAGEAAIVFPEGTRTTDGKLQPFQSGFCAIARRGGATIVPTTIDGAYAALPRGAKFPRPRPIALTFNEPITPDEIARLTDDELLALDDRADRLRETGPMHFRLLSYNIHKGIGGVDRRYDLGRIVDTIRAVPARRRLSAGSRRRRAPLAPTCPGRAAGRRDGARTFHLSAQCLAPCRTLWQRDSQPLSARGSEPHRSHGPPEEATRRARRALARAGRRLSPSR